MRTSWLLGVLAGFWMTPLSFASLLIDVGTFTLQANRPNQTVTLLVSGGDSVTCFNLRAQLGDDAGPSPRFQAVSFRGGIWDAYANTTTGGPVAGFEQYAQSSVAFNDNVSVPASGILTTLTIDTTGITTDSTYELKLSGVQLIGQDSDFVISGGDTLAAPITNGTVHVVVPEPATAGLLCAAQVVLCLRPRRA